MGGPECETATSKSSWALGFRSIMTVQYILVFGYCLKTFIKQLAKHRGHFCQRPLPTLTSAVLCSSLLLSIQIFHLCDVTYARFDKSVAGSAITLMESLTGSSGMVVFLDTALVWISVVQASRHGQTGGSTKMFKMVQNATIVYTIIYLIGYLGSAIVLLLVSRTMYTLLFYALFLTAGLVVIFTHRWGACQLHALKESNDLRTTSAGRVSKALNSSASWKSSTTLSTLSSIQESALAKMTRSFLKTTVGKVANSRTTKLDTVGDLPASVMAALIRPYCHAEDSPLIAC